MQSGSDWVVFCRQMDKYIPLSSIICILCNEDYYVTYRLLRVNAIYIKICMVSAWTFRWPSREHTYFFFTAQRTIFCIFNSVRVHVCNTYSTYTLSIYVGWSSRSLCIWFLWLIQNKEFFIFLVMTTIGIRYTTK